MAVDSDVRWQVMVSGAEVGTTLTGLDPGRGLSWRWSDGTKVDVALEDLDGGTAVTLINDGFAGFRPRHRRGCENATEGFDLVLADLKTMLESGTLSNVVRDKICLLETRP